MDNPQEAPTCKVPTTAAPQRIPLILKQLQSHNNPGLTEAAIAPSPDHRVTRQSSRLQSKEK